MNYNLLKKELKEHRWKFIIGTIILIVTGAVIPLTYQIINEMFQEMSGEQYSRFLPDLALMENTNYYIWSQWNAKNLYQIGTILALLLGINTIAGEVNKNTLGFLLTRPLSRKEAFFTKVIGGVVWLFLAVFISTIFLILLSIYEFGEVATGELLITTLITFCGFLVIYSFSILFSTLIDEPVKAGAVAALLIFISAVPGWFSKTSHLSLFSHIGGGKYFIEGQFPFLPVLVMILITAVFLVIAVNLFCKKEI